MIAQWFPVGIVQTKPWPAGQGAPGSDERERPNVVAGGGIAGDVKARLILLSATCKG